MEPEQFKELVARAEREAEADPRGYLLRTCGIAALGLGILGVLIVMVLVNVALIVGLLLVVVVTGGNALLFFAKLGKLLVLLAVPAWAMLRATFTLLCARCP